MLSPQEFLRTQYEHKETNRTQPSIEKDHSISEDEDASSPPAETDERDLIHIVHTRFMQHQGNLTTLGVARLKQFTAFCLPTMAHQTTQNFLWIIKVDPLLEENEESRKKVLEPLIEAVSAHEENNIYVVASNYNFNMEGHKGSWRDGQEGEELVASNKANKTLAKVYTGDLDRLRRAYELRQEFPVLETRLDADDGLSTEYIEEVQSIALDRFLGDGSSEDNKAEPIPKPQWLYWCILTQIEWHSEIYSNNNTNTTTSAAKRDSWEIRNSVKKYYGNQSFGFMVPIANENFCITPGLTVGYGIGASVESVPRYPHTSLYAKLHDKFKFCYAPEDKQSWHKGPCLERMGGVSKNPEGKTSYSIHAVRSRTVTSAGMDGVGNSDSLNQTVNESTGTTISTPKTEEQKKMEGLLWRIMTDHFAIDPQAVRRTQDYFSENRMMIALENSLGQCSMGHSCKGKARERLQKIVEAHSKLLNNKTL